MVERRCVIVWVGDGDRVGFLVDDDYGVIGVGRERIVIGECVVWDVERLGGEVHERLVLDFGICGEDLVDVNLEYYDGRCAWFEVFIRVVACVCVEVNCQCV